MTPRVDVHTLHADEPASRVVECLDPGHSRFPVVEGSVDNVLGVVGLAEVLTVPIEERTTTAVGEIAATPLLVPDSLSPAVLERLRAEHRQLACVVDEFGGFAGVISFEDVAEQVVGEILDEDDLAEAQAMRRPDGSWLVPGNWRMHEIADATGIALPEGEGTTTPSAAWSWTSSAVLPSPATSSASPFPPSPQWTRPRGRRLRLCDGGTEFRLTAQHGCVQQPPP